MSETNKEFKMKRSWFCKECGWGFDVKVGPNHQEGETGVSSYYCPNCKENVQFEHRVIENTDPNDELYDEDIFCNYCKELKPGDIMHTDFENYSHPVCDYCLEKVEPKHEIGNGIIAEGRAGIIDDREFENGKWTYRVSFDEINFGWFEEEDLKIYTDTHRDVQAQS